MTSTDPNHFDSRVVLGMYDTSIEAEAAKSTADGYLHGSVIEAYMELIRYDEWASGNREGDSGRIVEFAQSYGATFKDVSRDMYFRAEYKMLKGPMPNSLQQLIYACWDFSKLRHPK